MRLFSTTLLLPATALLATLLTAAKPTSPRAFHRAAPRSTPARPAPCPSEMEFISGKFCIDQFEASTVEIQSDGTSVRHSPFLPVTGLRVRAISQKGLVPQAYISRDEAQTACQESGKRLCGDEEWIIACKGPSATTFPYGNERQDGWCVDTNRVAPLARLFSNLGAARYQYEPMNDARLNQIAGTVAPTGSFAQCTNAFHVYDMVGNVHEWTSNPHGTFRGGYYLDTHLNGDGCDYRTVAHAGTYHDYSTGFRCCVDPK